LKIIAGESYIALIRFTPEGGVLLETINAYGASEKPESPHYADQMDLYVRRELKTMTLDWEEVLRTAERVYAPE
jgi:acyl-homoserine-lactone acylase